MPEYTTDQAAEEAHKERMGEAARARAAAKAVYPNLPSEGDDKWAFRKRLMANKADREKLYSYTDAEVGDQGPKAKQAFMETVVNRADAEGRTIGQILGTSYYPSVTHSRAARPLAPAARAEYESISKPVEEGSNVANFATGNASWDPKTQRYVGFAGGPHTATHGGERFGVEGWTSNWARKMGYSGDLPIQTSDEPKTARADGAKTETSPKISWLTGKPLPESKPTMIGMDFEVPQPRINLQVPQFTPRFTTA